MNQIIYVDVLICVNLFINYFILLSVVKILNLTLKRFKLILAASIGSIYSLTIFLPRLNFFLESIIKLLMSLSIVIAAFGFIKSRTLLKILSCFYLINFTFGGIIFFIWYFTSINGVFTKNGMIYFDISPIFLIMSTLITYFIMKLFNIMIGQKEIPLNFCKITFKYKNKSLTLRAKIDTGNTLREPFSNMPIIVTNYNAIKDLIKECNLYSALFLKDQAGYKDLIKIRMVPFKTIMGEGILPAFKMDEIIINYKNQIIKKSAYIAICKENIINPSYAAIINPDLINLC